MTLRPGDVEVGDEFPDLDLPGANGSTWNSAAHRTRDVPLVLILHRHLA